MVRNIIILLCLFLQQAYAEKKALIIGNQNYFNKEEKLHNPLIDAKDFSKRLKKFGFNVDATYMDLDSYNLKSIINNFSKNIKNDDIVIFYYSGHGVENNGENLLIPIDTNRIYDTKSLHQNSYFLTTFISNIKNVQARIVIVILDACRVNPYITKISGSKGGLGIPKTIIRRQEIGVDSVKDNKEWLGGYRQNLLIAYATAPNQLAKDGMPGISHSPYTEALLKNFDKSQHENILMFFNNVSLDVQAMTSHAQIPWNSNGGVPKFCFNGCSSVSNKKVIVSATHSKWQDIKENSNQTFTFKEAKEFCSNVDMRLPTKIELKKLYWKRSTLNYNSNLKYWSSNFEKHTKQQMVHTVCFSEKCVNSTLGSFVDEKHYVRCTNK